MKTATVTVYKFEELDDTRKEKVLDKFREINVDYEWYEFLEYDLRRELKEKGISFKKIFFDLNGAGYIALSSPCIDDEENVFSSFADTKQKDKQVLKHIEERAHETGIEINTDARGERTTLFIDDEENENFNELLNNYLTQLKKEYEYQLSDEAVKETIEANEYEFFKSGEVFHE